MKLSIGLRMTLLCPECGRELPCCRAGELATEEAIQVASLAANMTPKDEDIPSFKRCTHCGGLYDEGM